MYCVTSVGCPRISKTHNLAEREDSRKQAEQRRDEMREIKKSASDTMSVHVQGGVVVKRKHGRVGSLT